MLKQYLIRVSAIFIGAAIIQANPAAGQEPAVLLPQVERFAAVVRPMEHSLQGRLPLFMWYSGLPSDTSAARMYQSGSLHRQLRVYRERGYLPCVQMALWWNEAGAVAMANALQEEGMPVYLIAGQHDILESTSWVGQQSDVHGIDRSVGKERWWPCLPDADPQRGRRLVDRLLKPFEAQEIIIAGMFFDDEALPHPWNGIYDASRRSHKCATHFPTGTLDDLDAFKEFVYGVRAYLSTEVFAKPVKTRWPGAIVGNYGDTRRTPESKALEKPWIDQPPRDLGQGMDVLMPPLYASLQSEDRWMEDRQRTASMADRVHFPLLLGRLSLSAAAKANHLLIPYVGRRVADDHPERSIGMTAGAFRELIRHSLLRGADTFIVFGPMHYLDAPLADVHRETFEDVRVVYDEVLSFREFLDDGQPMNFTFPGLGRRPQEWPTGADEVTVWSGLRLADRALVRTFTLADTDRAISFDLFERTVELPATREGAWWLVTRSGRVSRINLPR